jgi:lysozyme family protein
MFRSLEQMIDDVLRREGGFVDHPSDRGGPTKYGITQATLSRHLGRTATVAEVRRLTQERAREIYRRDYFEAPGIDQLPERVQALLFDSAVNHGPARAIRFLQRVANDAGFGPLAEDGMAGPATRASAMAAEQVMQDWLTAALVEERRLFYHRIVDNDPAQRAFLAGWMGRLAEFEVPMEHLERMVA